MRERFACTLPLWPVTEEGRCSCGQNECRRPGKHPARNAPEGAGYVVVTGAEGGVFVVDCDVKGGTDGIEQFRRFLGLQPGEAFPHTLTIATGSGGLHFYFKHPGFKVTGTKPDSAIDIKGDKADNDGLVYVVGPGSPGYVTNKERTHATKGVADYEVLIDAPVADAPEVVLSWLRISANGTREDAFAPTPISPEHPDWDRRVDMAIEACKTMPESKGDGEGGKRLFAVCIRLIRTLELPETHALELIETFFNPRCTNDRGEPWPWVEEDIAHKIEDARDRSSIPCGIAPPEFHAMIASHTNPNRTPRVEGTTAPEAKDKVGAERAYDGERMKITRAGLVQMLYGTGCPDWDGVFWYDVLSRKVRATNPPLAGTLTLERGELSKGDLALVAHWLDVKGFLASKEMIEDAIWTVVRMPDRQVNPIANYLDALPPVSDVKVLPTLATDILKCTDPGANTLVMKTLVAAARRARNPGTFHKAMLVLKGDQRCGKTPFVKILAGPWYQTTGNGNLADRDTILECQGKWLVEVEELSALNKADADALKTAISRERDVITKKYEPDAQTYPRSFVLIGTTNKEEFLTDATGNVRYWVVEVPQGEKVDLGRLEELRDVIWAEADFLARAGESNELDEVAHVQLEATNATYLNIHPWERDVAAFLAGKKEVASATDVLLHVLKGDLTRADKRSKNEVADIMRTLGCESVRRKKDGRTIRFWKVPDNLSPARAPSVTPLKVIK